MSDARDAAPPADIPREDAVPAAASDETPSEESRIVIRPDGQVVIENLSALLAEVATSLDPDAELACRLELDEPRSNTDDEHPDP